MSYTPPSVMVPGAGSVRVCVASTPDEIAQGLMGVRSLPVGVGMLFAFPSAASGAFWMKDTPLPLDIIFIDAMWRVVSVRQGVPMSHRSIEPGGPYRFVLEVPRGWAEAHRVSRGTALVPIGV